MEKELRRRVWWCVYSLDRVLSISLGRPLATHDDDCTVEYRKFSLVTAMLSLIVSAAAEIDDSNLIAWSDDGVGQVGESYMTGFNA